MKARVVPDESVGVSLNNRSFRNVFDTLSLIIYTLEVRYRFFGICGFFLLAIPLLSLKGFQKLSMVTLHDAQVQDSALVGLSLGIFMMMAVAVDSIFLKFHSEHKSSIPSSSSRIFLILTLIVPSVLVLIFVNSVMDPRIVFSLSSLRAVLRIYAIFSYFKSAQFFLSHNNFTFFYINALNLAIIIRDYAFYYDTDHQILFWIAALIHIISFFFLMYLSSIQYAHLLSVYEAIPWCIEHMMSVFYMYFIISILITWSCLSLSLGFYSESITTVQITALFYTEIILIIVISMSQTKIIGDIVRKTQDALDQKRNFVRAISHEIRTPLNTVFIGLDVLMDEIHKLGHFPQLIDIVIDLQGSGETALGIINDFLTYDKLDAGILMLELERHPIWELVESTIRPFFLQARQKHIKIILDNNLDSVFSFNLKEVLVYMDKIKISQVIRNLISNALKFSPPESNIIVFASVEQIDTNTPLPPDIEVAYRSVPLSMIRISVQDQGPGLTAENQKQLFKRIVQFNPGKLQKGGGSGLGLWISQKVSLMHGGKLSVQSDGEGYGCTFSLDLPFPHSGGVKSITRTKSMIKKSGFLPFSFRIEQSSRVQEGENSSVARNSWLLDAIARKASPVRRLSLRSETPSAENAPTNFPEHLELNSNNCLSDDSESGEVWTVTRGNDNESDGDNVDDSHALSRITSKLRLPSIIRSSISSNENVSVSGFGDTFEEKSDTDEPIRRKWVKHQGSHDDEDEVDAKLSPRSQSFYQLNGRGGARIYRSEVDSRDGLKSEQDMGKLVSMNRLLTFKPRTLIVDDAMMNRKMLARLMQSRCKSIVQAEDGKEAIACVKESMKNSEPFDLIMMDFMMPIMDGPSATREIIKMGFTGLIVGVTGNADPVDINHFMAHGASKVLVKPVKKRTINGLLFDMQGNEKKA